MAGMFVPTQAEVKEWADCGDLLFCGTYNSLRELKKHVGHRKGNIALCRRNDAVCYYVWDGKRFALIHKVKTLKLVLKGKWYRMIESGEKPDEYREQTDYYHAKFRAPGVIYDRVTFYLGYSKNRPQMTFSIKEIVEGTGREEWGATPGKVYYMIKLGDRICKWQLPHASPRTKFQLVDFL